MRAVTIEPRRKDSQRLDDIPEPGASEGPVLVRALAVGVCGTDRELIEGRYGAAPPGHERLVLGHESLGRVVEAPAESGLRAGDFVVGIVRHPDPVPCSSCAVGEWDMCRNGRYTERGIKEANGFAAQLWRNKVEFTVRVSPDLGLAAVLLEPATILAKAWEHIERIGRRAHWEPRRVLVTGAGPVGLMAALMAAQRRLEVHVLDHNDEGPKPKLVRDLGARFHLEYPADEFDVIIECTGVAKVVERAVGAAAPAGIVCLTGLGGREHVASFDTAVLNESLVLGNRVIFGSVNANRRHYQAAADALARAERGWLEGIIARRVPLARWSEAYEKRDSDVKTVLQFAD